MDNIAFVVFKPDLVHQRLQQPVMEFLLAGGAEILACKSGFITPEKRVQLYSDHQRIGQTNWELGGKLYTLGPANFLMLSARDRNYEGDFAEYLSSSLKGHFVPRRAPLNTIRGGFNALNPVFNLIHMSDNADRAMEEASIFFDTEELRRCGSPGDNLKASAITHSQPKLMSVSKLVFSLLDMILACAGITRPTDSPDPMSPYQHQGAVRGERKHLFMDALDAAREALGSSRIYESASTLLDYRNYKGVAFADFRNQLTELGVYLNKWDWYLLETSMYYFDFEPA